MFAGAESEIAGRFFFIIIIVYTNVSPAFVFFMTAPSFWFTGEWQADTKTGAVQGEGGEKGRRGEKREICGVLRTRRSARLRKLRCHPRREEENWKHKAPPLHLTVSSPWSILWLYYFVIITAGLFPCGVQKNTETRVPQKWLPRDNLDYK